MNNLKQKEVEKLMRNFFKQNREKQHIKFKEVKEKLKKELILHDKSSLLKWISVTSLLPGNEIYNLRFSFLKKLILSIEDKSFSNKKVDNNIIKSLLTIMELLDWSSMEDWEPRKMIKNEFGICGEVYNFIPGLLEHPEKILEKITTRFLSFEKDLKDKFGYSIKNEFLKILKLQNDISLLIKDSKNHQTGKFSIPRKKLVGRVDNLFKKCKISQKLFKNPKKIDEPSTIEDADNFFIFYPINKGNLCNLSNLIYAFSKKIIFDLKYLNNDKIINHLNTQLKRDVLISLLEVVPFKGIIENFSIGTSSTKFDFGFIFDNKFFIIKLTENNLDQNLLIKEINSLFKKTKKINNEFSKDKLKLKIENKTKDICNKLDPIFLIIKDELIEGHYPLSKTNGLVLNYSSFKDIFEDLSSKKRDPLYLSKVIKKFKEVKIPVLFDFCDFYDAMESKELALAFFKKGMIMVDPHLHSYKQESILKERPKLDIRPKEYPLPYTFKILKLDKNLLYGYNNLLAYNFYYVPKVSWLYIFRKERTLLNNEDWEISNVLAGMICFYLQEISKLNLINNQNKSEITLELCPKAFFKEGSLPENLKNLPLILGESKQKFVLIFDNQKFGELFMKDPFKLSIFFEKFLIKKLFGKEDYKLIEDKLYKLNPFSQYKLSKYNTVSNKGTYFQNYPTQIDFLDEEIAILNKIKDVTKSGVYKRTEADRIIKIGYDFLIEKLLGELKNYNFFKFIKFAYAEAESLVRLRELTQHRYQDSIGMDIELEMRNFFKENEGRIQQYFPACRFLIEQAIMGNIDGNKEIYIEDWQRLCAIAIRLLTFAHISDYLQETNENFVDIKLKIDLENKANFEIIIEDNPISKHIEDLIANLKKHSVLDKKINNKPQEEDIKSFYKKFNSIEKGSLKKLNQELEKDFGFKIPDYILTLNVLTNMKDGLDKNTGIICTSTQKMIDFVNKKTEIDKTKIGKIIDFSKLCFKGAKKIPEPWRITQEDRLTVKPLIEKDGKIVFAPGVLTLAEQNIVNSLVEGKWVYSNREKLNKNLKKVLNLRKNKVSKEFEKAVYKDVNKHTKYCDHNIGKSKRNNKCLKNIEELCPGEIDVISLHPKNKKLILWEAKDIERKFGSREIISDLCAFTEKDGFIEKVKVKIQFLQKNLKSILDYYKISDKTNWEVDYTFVFSSINLIKCFLEKRTKIISFSEIKEFITNLN